MVPVVMRDRADGTREFFVYLGRERHGWAAGKWNFIGGKTDYANWHVSARHEKIDRILRTAKSELNEEIGVDVRRHDIVRHCFQVVYAHHDRRYPDDTTALFLVHAKDDGPQLARSFTRMIARRLRTFGPDSKWTELTDARLLHLTTRTADGWRGVACPSDASSFVASMWTRLRREMRSDMPEGMSFMSHP